MSCYGNNVVARKSSCDQRFDTRSLYWICFTNVLSFYMNIEFISFRNLVLYGGNQYFCSANLLSDSNIFFIAHIWTCNIYSWPRSSSFMLLTSLLCVLTYFMISWVLVALIRSPTLPIKPPSDYSFLCLCALAFTAARAIFQITNLAINYHLTIKLRHVFKFKYESGLLEQFWRNGQGTYKSNEAIIGRPSFPQFFSNLTFDYLLCANKPKIDAQSAATDYLETLPHN